MSKKQYIVRLSGYTADGVKASTQQGGQVTSFRNERNSVKVTNHSVLESTDQRTVTLETRHGRYILLAHNSIDNLFIGRTNTGIKLHFTKKKIVAKLIYWA